MIPAAGPSAIPRGYAWIIDVPIKWREWSFRVIKPRSYCATSKLILYIKSWPGNDTYSTVKAFSPELTMTTYCLPFLPI